MDSISTYTRHYTPDTRNSNIHICNVVETHLFFGVLTTLMLCFGWGRLIFIRRTTGQLIHLIENSKRTLRFHCFGGY